jgi:hypothetical protein
MIRTYDDHGIRFQYPLNWELEVFEDDSERMTVTVQAPSGLAFLMVTIDEARPAPAKMAEEALAAMREEYASLDAYPAHETIAGHMATGHDVEFVSLDMINFCSIRSYRTEFRTVLVFAQWSDLAEENADSLLLALKRSLEETVV